MGGDRDTTCVRLLEELARSDEGFLSLPVLKHRKPHLAHGIEQFVHGRWIDQLYSKYPACINHLFFDQNIQALVVDDPQLTFYLGKLQFSALAKEVGKVISLSPQRVFVSYSHKDAQWLERLQVHLTPLEYEGIIDLWDDTKIEAGAKWREEIQTAIELSVVAVILVSADFLASNFISRYELPNLLSRAQAEGTIILPLIVSPCLFTTSGLNIFQAINSPDRPLIEMSPSESERTLVKLAEAISKRFAVMDT